MTPERVARVKEVLSKRQPDFCVLMDEVNKPHNLSAIVRTCDAVGIDEVYATTPSKRTRFGADHAGGSTRWVTIHQHPNAAALMMQMKAEGKQLLAAHLSNRAVDFRAMDYTRPTCLVVGSEKYGVSAVAADLADEHIIIPMDGMVQSLNVSVASAIVLYEVERQRRNAGMYLQRRLGETQWQRRLLEWLHPRVAEYCRRHQLAYPGVTEDGDLTHNPGECDVELAPEDGLY